MKKVVYWYGPRDITIVCTEIQIDRAIYFVCSKYYFILWLYEGNVNGMKFKYDTCILWLVHINFLYSLTRVKIAILCLPNEKIYALETICFNYIEAGII